MQISYRISGLTSLPGGACSLATNHALDSKSPAWASASSRSFDSSGVCDDGRELVAACSLAMCSPKYRAMSWLMPLRVTTSRRAESPCLMGREGSCCRLESCGCGYGSVVKAGRRGAVRDGAPASSEPTLSQGLQGPSAARGETSRPRRRA